MVKIIKHKKLGVADFICGRGQLIIKLINFWHTKEERIKQAVYTKKNTE